MKREGARDSGNGPATKSSRGDTSSVKLRFLVPGRAAGIIIGKQGENIKSIRSSYNVKLNIPDSGGPERIFMLEGDLGTCCEIVRDLLVKLKDVMSAKLSDPKRLMGNRKRSREEEEEDDEFVDLRLLVHRSQVGSVIGKGGERIKELRENNKMKVIKVYQVLAPMSTDRIVQMVSDADGVVSCLQSVVEIIESVPPRGAMDDYNANNWNECEALEYGGWLSREAHRNLSNGVPIGSPSGGGYGYGGGMDGPRGRRDDDRREGRGFGGRSGRDDRMSSSRGSARNGGYGSSSGGRYDDARGGGYSGGGSSGGYVNGDHASSYGGGAYGASSGYGGPGGYGRY